MSEEYEKALEEANAASTEFRRFQLAYRAKEISDDVFLEAQAVHDAACKKFEIAWNKEQDALEEAK